MREESEVRKHHDKGRHVADNRICQQDSPKKSCSFISALFVFYYFSYDAVKSSLCISLDIPKEEDDHPLNDIMGSSWSSVSSADSFLSTTSSGYQTASEGL